MSITITTDVFCEMCTEWVFGAVGSEADIHAARRNAKKQGWFYIKHNGYMIDVCPTCKQELDAEYPATEATE